MNENDMSPVQRLCYRYGVKPTEARFDAMLPAVLQLAWVPVTEKLPEEGLTVLTSDINGGVDFGSYENGKWYWLAEACTDYWARNDGVLAWQPLPAPFKG